MTTSNSGSSVSISKPGVVRLWLMRLTAMVLMPLLVLGALEGLLRLSGYGYSTRFFVPSIVGGVDYRIPNEKFPYRFFPPALARPVVPFRMAAEKPEGTFRIFVFGASAALGDPDPNYGMVRLLEELLEARYPDTDFEVICTAMTAINSHVVLPIARDCARHDGDLWVIYLGNNEMIGPFGAGTVFGKKAPSVDFVRAGLIAKSTRLGQLMMDLLGKLKGDAAMPDEWTGIDMFKDHPLPYDDPGRARVYSNYRKNLEAILALGGKAGVPVVLSTVGSNLRDCSPFASMHTADLDSSSLKQWDAAFETGRVLEEKGDFEGALSSYRLAEGIDPSYAELQYRIGICLLEIGMEEQARTALLRARDYDALAVRADSRINEIIRSVAAGEDASEVMLVDAVAEISRKGVPGREWFYEHVHLTPEGNYRVARLIAEHIESVLPETITRSRINAWTEMKECLDARALTDWDRYRLYYVIYERISMSPHEHQSDNTDNKAFIDREMDEIVSGYDNDIELPEGRSLYESALAHRPEDVSLTLNYAQFLESNELKTEALEYAYRFRDLMPDLAWSHYYLAHQLANNGQYEQAERSLEKALDLLSDFTLAENTLKIIRGRK
jgi:tetratricopeptide (TPR) repeat protein